MLVRLCLLAARDCMRRALQSLALIVLAVFFATMVAYASYVTSYGYSVHHLLVAMGGIA